MHSIQGGRRTAPAMRNTTGTAASFPAGWLLGPIMVATAILIAVLGVGQADAAPAGKDTLAMLLPEPRAGRSGAMTSADCARCHTVQPVFSHPTGMRASMDVPTAFPLEDGNLTCITCHETSIAAHDKARRTHTGMLRQTGNPAGLCAECHAANAFDRKNQHALSLALAHTAGTWKGRKDTKTRGTESSRSCVSCHDGTVASDGFPKPGRTGTFMGVQSQSHPVDIAYPNNRSTKNGALVSIRGVDARVRLPGDQVSCISCHSLYSQESKLLVMSNRDSRLCLTCHTDR